jgi:hypothetical protein
MFMRVQAQSRRPGDQDPLGEIQKRPFQLSFNASLRVDFQGSRVTLSMKERRAGLWHLQEPHCSRREAAGRTLAAIGPPKWGFPIRPKKEIPV